jgi:hypothetical protein
MKYPHQEPVSPLVSVVGLTIVFLAMTACGGGGGSQTPPPTPDFSLAVSPTSQTVNAGASAVVSLSANPISGFSSQVGIQVMGLPSGVSVSPSNISLVPGTTQPVTFTAAANAATGTATVTFTGTSGSLTHTARLTLTVNSAFSGGPGRNRYLRSDATTPYFAWLNQHWTVFHPGTSRFFVTDPYSGRVFVFDATSETEIGSILIPGAYGIDETPDHSTLYVGTLIGDVYAVDPVAMTVAKRYIASEIGPYGFEAFSALVMADGRLALLGAQGGIPSVDGSSAFAIWNPADNSIILYGATGLIQGLPVPCGAFMGNIGGFALTADRSTIMLGSIDSDGTLCEVNPSTGQGIYVNATSFSLYHLITSPDNKYIILPSYPNDAVLYDAKTLDKVAQFSVAGDTSSASGFAVSADSKTLFVPTDSTVFAYDLATHQQVGWLSNIFLPPSSGGMAVGPIDSPYLTAVDGTGLFAGPMEEGVGFIDTSALKTGPVGTLFSNAYLSPLAGPVSGGTQTKWNSQMPADKLGAVYFGSQRAPSASDSNGFITATTPPGTPGPVTVFAAGTDGSIQFVPDGFSYGPTILEVAPNASTVEGGGTGFVYGYGFGSVTDSGIPADLKVSIGGTNAQITGFNPNAYNLLSPPYLLQSFSYTIPAGVAGLADVTVTKSTGTITSHGALTYLPPIQKFSLRGSALAQGIYDAHRDVYYFTDNNQVQIFSRTQGKWLSPISIPPPPGMTQRLWGISLSPDGTKLAVSDALAGVIYLLDPSNPTLVKTFQVGSQFGFIVNPCGVAVSDSGNVYFAVYVQGGTGADQFFKLNTKTGAVTDYGINSPGLGVSDLYLRAAISLDNSRAFFNDLGYVFSVDTATDKIFSASVDPGCCYGDYDLALSMNQTQFTATEYLYDSDLNGESYYALNDREILNVAYVYGAKLSPDGKLAFQPSVNGIDVFDGRLGNLLTRISLPVALSPNYDALVHDGRDNILVAITGTNGDGVAVIDLTSVGEPPPLLYDSTGEAPLHRYSELGNRWLAGARPRRHEGKKNSRPTQLRTVPHVTRTVLVPTK